MGGRGPCAQNVLTCVAVGGALEVVETRAAECLGGNTCTRAAEDKPDIGMTTSSAAPGRRLTRTAYGVDSRAAHLQKEMHAEKAYSTLQATTPIATRCLRTTPLSTRCLRQHHPASSAVYIRAHATDAAAGASTTSVSRVAPTRHESSRVRISSRSRSRPITTSWLTLFDPSGQSSSSNW